MTPGELAERLNVATPTVVKSASRMQTAGLIERRVERCTGGAIHAFYRRLLSGGPTFTGDVRPAIRVGGLALTSTQFERGSLDADGQTIAIRTATAEVARRQPDGTWRRLIDQPDVLAR